MNESAPPPVAPSGAGPLPHQEQAERTSDPSSPKGGAVGDSAAPPPLGGEVRPTGNAEVDARLRRLQDAGHLAVPELLGVYEDVHRGLRDTLTALDQRPGPDIPGGPHNARS